MRTSKYKHTLGKEFKREQWYTELRIGEAGGDVDGIAASAKWVAFPGTGGGGSIQLLPLTLEGQKGAPEFSVVGHTAPVTAIQFSPFDDNVFATGSEDCSVKVWTIPEGGLSENLQDPTFVLQGHSKRVDWLQWHPTASDILATMSGGDRVISIWNTQTGEKVRELGGFGDAPQCFSWNFDGSLIAATCKDKKLRVFDVRAEQIIQEGPGHEGLKGSRVLFLGRTNLILTTGFTRDRCREMHVHETAEKVSKSWQIDSSTGALMVKYDDDTNLLFIAGKGDSPIRFYEVTTNKPYLHESAKIGSASQHVGIALISKRACNVMNTEVVRLLKLCRDCIIPVGFTVPRKSKSEYHPDLFPDTPGTTPGQTADEWLGGANATVPLVSLTPEVTCTYAATSAAPKQAIEAPKVKLTSKKWGGGGGGKWGSGGGSSKKWGAKQGGDDAAPAGAAINQFRPEQEEEKKPETRKIVVPKVVRRSAFRHIMCKANKAEECYFAVKASTSLPVESSMLHANGKYFAVPWKGTAGRLAIISEGNFGKVPTDYPTFDYPSEFTDVAFDPFNPNVVVTAADNTHVLVWTIPEGGLTEPINTPTKDLTGHQRRAVCVQFHPSAQNVLATGGADNTVRLWNLDTEEEISRLEGFENSPNNLAWHLDGERMAVCCKDKHLRVFMSRSGELLQDVVAHEGSKAFTAMWNGDQIISVGFSKTSVREIKVWESADLSKPVRVKTLDLASGVGITYFDPDIGVLYLAGKGDGSILTFEINDDGIHPLSPHTSPDPQNALALLPKHSCDVRNCEVARFAKLSIDKIEPLAFKVPRTRNEFFQDDIFPLTRANTPAISAAEFAAGADATALMVSLKPDDMTPLSEAPKEEKKMRTEVATNLEDEDRRTDKEKLMEAFEAKMDDNAGDTLPQDLNEGAAADEWSD